MLAETAVYERVQISIVSAIRLCLRMAIAMRGGPS
jgi:hypothetical protein